ncbi:MAG TPA: hypothetical protein VNT52_14350 [Acidimicrobiales bacterium]|nr:hypothetical protein [Acidimicrobiales bacterium]
MRAPGLPAAAEFDEELLSVELAELLGFVADFLARAEGPLLRADFAAFTYGSYTLDELRAALGRFAGWLAGEGRP